jgi:hypothetical protein
VSRGSRVQNAVRSRSAAPDRLADAIAMLEDAALNSVIHSRPLKTPSRPRMSAKGSSQSVLGLTPESVSNYFSKAPKVSIVQLLVHPHVVRLTHLVGSWVCVRNSGSQHVCCR